MTSRGRLCAWLLLAGAASVASCSAMVGCGNDFDALFPSDPAATTPPPAGSGGTDGGVADGSKDTSDAQGGGDGGAGGCGTPAPEAMCVDKNEKDDDEISKACSGCQCPCKPFACENRDGRKCSTTCSEGTTCETTCKSDECKLEVQAATATLRCTDKARRCELTCDQGSSCDLICENSGSCSATCAPGSKCLVRCPTSDGGKPDRCNVVCQEGAPQSCPQGITTCNRACP